MILNEIFSEFISVVQEDDKYIIGLVNNDGELVECSCEIDENMYTGFDNVCDNEFFYKINVNGTDFGYLWVMSSDNSLKMVGNLLGESLSTRIMYELNSESLKRTVTKDDELVKCFLDTENFDIDTTVRLIEELEKNSSVSRTAIHISNDNGFNVDEILRLKMYPENKEVIYSLLDNQTLLIFKDVADNLSEDEIKSYLNKYIRGLKNWGLFDCFYVVGSLQTKLSLYSSSYKNCQWIKNNVVLTKDQPVFFMDYLYDYFIDQINLYEVSDVFEYFRQGTKSIDTSELIQIADTMYHNDFNITQTAEDLFMHKNSLIYKVKKYEEVFSINIRGSFKGKFFFYLISELFRMEEKQKQVGAKL